MDREAGQATVEALAAIPLLLLAGAIALQLLATGYALSIADGAAEAGALALAAGRPAATAARKALPDWAEGEATVSVSRGEVSVRLPPPSFLPAVSDTLVVSSSAFARGPKR
jgi:hypothetical protein